MIQHSAAHTYGSTSRAEGLGVVAEVDGLLHVVVAVLRFRPGAAGVGFEGRGPQGAGRAVACEGCREGLWLVEERVELGVGCRVRQWGDSHLGPRESVHPSICRRTQHSQANQFVKALPTKRSACDLLEGRCDLQGTPVL